MTCAMARTGPDASSRTMGLAAGGTTSVGVTVSRSTRCVVEPKKKRAAPVWPCVPSTMRVACEAAAAFRISTCGSPTRTSSVAGCANAVDVTDDARAASACRHSLWITSAVDGHRRGLHEERLDDVHQRQGRTAIAVGPGTASARRRMADDVRRGRGKIHGA